MCQQNRVSLAVQCGANGATNFDHQQPEFNRHKRHLTVQSKASAVSHFYVAVRHGLCLFRYRADDDVGFGHHTDQFGSVDADRHYRFSFGTTTFLINLLFYLIEAVLLGKAMPKWNILQIPAVLVFGIFIDLGMAVAKLIEPTSWPAGLVMSLAGNLWLAVGIVLQVRSKTLVQPGEGAVLAISVVTRKAFGSIKVFFDCFLVLSAAVLGFLILNEIVGIREGTLLSAVLVGSLVKGISKLFPEKKKN